MFRTVKEAARVWNLSRENREEVDVPKRGATHHIWRPH